METITKLDDKTLEITTEVTTKINKEILLKQEEMLIKRLTEVRFLLDKFK
jgi:hypothetical protein